jgi:hypothetical protein
VQCLALAVALQPRGLAPADVATLADLASGLVSCWPRRLAAHSYISVPTVRSIRRLSPQPAGVCRQLFRTLNLFTRSISRPDNPICFWGLLCGAAAAHTDAAAQQHIKLHAFTTRQAGVSMPVLMMRVSTVHPQAGHAAAAAGDVTAAQHAYVATAALLAALLPLENAEGAAMDADERSLGAFCRMLTPLRGEYQT